MASNLTVPESQFPAGAQCIADALSDLTSFSTYHWHHPPCNVTTDMVAALGLTSDFSTFFAAYCAADPPPPDDGCPYGFCPSPDIAGPLVRISVYLTNALVAILLFYSKEKVGDSVWTQVISVYALTIAAGVSIFKSRLTRIHAILTIAIAGSPLSLYIVVNALLSMLAGGLRPGHSLASVFGGNRKFHVRIIARLIVLGAFAVWFTLLVYTLSPSHHNHFAQFSCEGSIVYGGNAIIGSIFVLPIYVFLNIGKLSPVIITSPAQLTVIAWLVAIVLKRHEIWRGGGFKFHFQRVWRTVVENYPFLHFFTVVVLPLGWWLITIELAIWFASTQDEQFIPTFGQLVAILVTVIPMIDVIRLLPDLGTWFIDLAWVRFLSCRPQKRRKPDMADTSLQGSLHEVGTTTT